MTEEDKQKMLLEERYATLRTMVRDKNEVYRRLKSDKFCYEIERTNLLATSYWFSFISNMRIRRLTQKINGIDAEIDMIAQSLYPIAEEITEIEGKLGVRAFELYGKQYGWWIRR